MLLVGSEHFILDTTSNLNFIEIFNQIKLSDATAMVATPSFIDLLLIDKSFENKILPNLQTIILCGEKLLSSTVSKLYSRFNNIKIINCYGPTECTFAVTSIEIKKEMLNIENIPVGIKKDDVDIYIVDEDINIIENEKIGEILVVGESVADGYISNENSRSFIKYKGRKAYLTGDMGYIRDGILYYIARKDKQIKYKGYRIELTDIEKNIQQLNYVDKAIAIAKKNKYGKVLGIYAFVKLKEDKEKNIYKIKQDLKNKIPEYMYPKIKIIKEFPINKNGKCDEKRLLEEF